MDLLAIGTLVAATGSLPGRFRRGLGQRGGRPRVGALPCEWTLWNPVRTVTRILAAVLLTLALRAA